MYQITRWLPALLLAAHHTTFSIPESIAGRHGDLGSINSTRSAYRTSRPMTSAEPRKRITATRECDTLFPYYYVSPCGEETLTLPAGSSGHFAVFTITNNQSFDETFMLECAVSGAVSSCTSDHSQITVLAQNSTTVTVLFATGMIAGNGILSLNATPTVEPGDTFEGFYNVVTTLYHSADHAVTNNDNQDVGLCAASCFAATYAQSTVPYYSLGQARGVTLVYNEDRASLKPFVHVDVSPNAGATAGSEMWLQAKVDGVPVTFANGEQTLRYGSAAQQARVGGQFNAAAYGTGVRALQIISTGLYPGGTQQQVIDTRLITLDHRASPVARGWTIAGLQRLHVQPGGALLVDESGGSASYFAKTTCSGDVCHVSPAGDFSRMRTLSAGGYMRVSPDSSKATFNSAGRLMQVADRFGNAVDFEYDASGRLTKIYDPIRTYNGGASRSYIALTYGAYGLAQIQEPGPDGSPTGGRVTYITVASDSTLRVFKDPDGDSTTFGYDGSRRLSTITDRRGGLTTYNYDSMSGKLASVDLPTVTLWNGTTVRPRTSQSPWQKAGVPTGSTATTLFTPVATATVRGTTTDAINRQASFTADRRGQPLSMTDPIGRTTTITRSGVNPISIQHHTGAIDYARFAGPLPTGVTPAGETEQNINYGGWAQPDSTWGAGRPAMRMFLGLNGRVDSARVGGLDSTMTRFTYDGRGRVLSQQDPKGNFTYFHYDPVFGNLDSTLAPGGRFTRVTFDSVGRIRTQQSNDEPQRQVVYDALNRAREVYDGVNPAPTRYAYDPLFLTRVEDPKGQVFRFEHNALGWVTREFDPADTLGRFDQYGYDTTGRVRVWTNRRGQQVSYTYDQLDRVTSKSGTNTTTDSMVYSADGLRMVSWNSVARDSVFFRINGWVDSVVTRIGGRRFRAAYQPNDVGQLDGVTFANDASITFASRRFGWNRQTGALDTAFVYGQMTRFARDRALLPVQTIWPSVTRTTQWTAIHRPGEQSFSVGAINDSLFRRYSYDSRANLRDRIRWEGSNFRTQQAGYDGLRRLGNQGSNLRAPSSCPWDAANGFVCPLTFQHQVTFDAGGNRTDAPNAAYATGNRIQSFGNYTFAHDLDGNVTQKYNTVTGENKQFEWSAEGRLVRVLVNGTERVRYDYDARGQLVRRWTNGAVDRHFLWDQGHILAELDASATQRLGEYAYLPGADQPLALVTGAQAIGAVRYFVRDAVGNVIGLMNGTTLDQRVSYNDWGVPTVSGSADNRLLFKGLLWEGNHTGMYYVRARWYDPELGRFVREDPCGLVDGTNLYTFAGSDAINGSDPSGCLSLRGVVKGVKKAIKRLAPAAIGFGVTALAAAAGPLSLSAALAGTAQAFAATAAGSAIAAGIENIATGRSFARVFERNFNISGALLGAGSAVGLFSGGVQAVGANNLIQGFVATSKGSGALTLGSSSWFAGVERGTSLWRGAAATIGQHEFGHTIQFIVLSQLRTRSGGPWLPYLGMGLLGIAGNIDGFSTILGGVGCGWELSADILGGGGLASCLGPVY